MRAEFVALISAIRQFFEDLDNTHINSFLEDWPPVKCRTRSIAPLVLPVLSWMPDAVAAAHQKAAFLVKMLASMANQIAWGQTYSENFYGLACSRSDSCGTWITGSTFLSSSSGI